MDRDIILNGIHIGEHGFEPEKIKDEIYERCIKSGLNFVTLRPCYKTRRNEIPQHYFVEWARYLAENKIYFIFLYTVQHAPEGRKSLFDAETVTEMKKIAGKYFIGDMIGEVGSSMACKFAGYFANRARRDKTVIRTDYPDMKAAHDGYVESVGKYIEVDKALGMPEIVSVEATGLNKYNAEAGVTIPMLELMCGNPEILVSSLRGCARAFDSKLWGTYVAHEWYGGMRHTDILKRKRLELAYKYAYMAGTNVLCLESGDEAIESYGEVHDKDSELCREYRKVIKETMELIREDIRPKGGPRVRVAFVSGLHDAYGGWGGSSVWNQFGRKEWGHGDAEYSWSILNEVGTRRAWHDIANFGENDTSAYPAFGMYDIVPIEADVEKLLRYDYLIFIGWNSMTDENADKLYEYVKRGGKLLMTAAHLNCKTVRDGSVAFPSEERITKLFGCRFTGEIAELNDGVKFSRKSLDEKRIYPGSEDMMCDPIYSAGYIRWAKAELCGGYDAAIVSSSFVYNDLEIPAVVENKVGKGVATLVTSIEYPGNNGLRPLYRDLVREIITESARDCGIKVFADDKVRYSVYNGDKVYLLNTDYDIPANVRVVKGGIEHLVALAPLELEALEI